MNKFTQKAALLGSVALSMGGTLSALAYHPDHHDDPDHTHDKPHFSDMVSPKDTDLRALRGDMVGHADFTPVDLSDADKKSLDALIKLDAPVLQSIVDYYAADSDFWKKYGFSWQTNPREIIKKMSGGLHSLYVNSQMSDDLDEVEAFYTEVTAHLGDPEIFVGSDFGPVRPVVGHEYLPDSNGLNLSSVYLDVHGAYAYFSYARYLQSSGVKDISEIAEYKILRDLSEVIQQNQTTILSAEELKKVQQGIKYVVLQLNPHLGSKEFDRQLEAAIDRHRGGIAYEVLEKKDKISIVDFPGVNAPDRVGPTNLDLDLQAAVDRQKRMQETMGTMAYGLTLLNESITFGQYDITRQLTPFLGKMNGGIGDYLDGNFAFIDETLGFGKGAAFDQLGFQDIENNYLGFFDGGAGADLQEFGISAGDSARYLRSAMSVGFGMYEPDLNVGRIGFMDEMEGQGFSGFEMRGSMASHMGRQGGDMPFSSGATYIPSSGQITKMKITNAVNISSGLAVESAAGAERTLRWSIVGGELGGPAGAALGGTAGIGVTTYKMAEVVQDGKTEKDRIDREQQRREDLDKVKAEADQAEEDRRRQEELRKAQEEYEKEQDEIAKAKKDAADKEADRIKKLKDEGGSSRTGEVSSSAGGGLPRWNPGMWERGSEEHEEEQKKRGEENADHAQNQREQDDKKAGHAGRYLGLAVVPEFGDWCGSNGFVVSQPYVNLDLSVISEKPKVWRYVPKWVQQLDGTFRLQENFTGQPGSNVIQLPSNGRER